MNGKKLSADKLSGNLLKTQAFRGTICGIKELQYLKQKLNGQLLPAVDEAAQAENQMVQKIIPLMHLLRWQDFELLIDLVFSNSGWRRTGQVGKTQKTVDIELMLPTTAERAFVQIKSSARKQDLDDYLERFKNSDAYDKMFFVWHSDSNVVLIGPDRLARMEECKSVRAIGGNSRKGMLKFRLYILQRRGRRGEICSRDPHFSVAIAADIFQAVGSSQWMLWINILEGL